MTDIIRNDDTSRYELSVDGDVVGYISYERSVDNVFDLQHTIVDPAHGGKGYAGDLTKYALEDARSLSATIVPSCPYVARYLEKHEEYRDLVA